MDIKGFKSKDGTVHQYDYDALANKPDSSQNVDLSGYVKSVNGQNPDENGNVEISMSGGNVNVTSIPRSSDTRFIGEIFKKPDVYTAWPLGNVQYDKNSQKVVMAINGKPGHTTGQGKVYFATLNPQTYEVSELTVLAEDETYGCVTQSFCILDDGSYLCMVRVHAVDNVDTVQETRKYVSTDKGVSWTYTVDLTMTDGTLMSDMDYWMSVTCMIQLSNKRLIASVNDAIVYSDDNGETWTESVKSGIGGEIFLLELSGGKMLAIGRAGWTLGNTTSPAYISTSSDYGTTWTGGAVSASIADMSGNPCFGVYYADEKLVELFYCSRSSAGGDGEHYGTIYSQIATEEDAFNDNFEAPKILGYSDQTSVGIHFGYMAGAKDARNACHLFYYDVDKTGVNWKYLRTDRYNVESLPKNDTLTTPYTGWTSAKIASFVDEMKTGLTAKIEYLAALIGAEDVPDEIQYASDGLVYYLHSSDYEQDASVLTAKGGAAEIGGLSIKRPEKITKTNNQMILSSSYYQGVAGFKITDTTKIDELMAENGQFELELVMMNPSAMEGSYFLWAFGNYININDWGYRGHGISGMDPSHGYVKNMWNINYGDSAVYINHIYDGSKLTVKINDEVFYEAETAITDFTVGDLSNEWIWHNIYANFGSFRLYNRVLTDEERAMNRALDKSYFEN